MADIVIFRTKYCGYCVLAKRFLDHKGLPFKEVDITGDHEQREWLTEVTGMRTVPQIFINGQPVGGYTELVKLDKSGKLDALLTKD